MFSRINWSTWVVILAIVACGIACGKAYNRFMVADVFVVYQGSPGAERIAFQQTYVERRIPGIGHRMGGPPTINYETVFTVWNGGPTPVYCQFWKGTKSGGGKSEPRLERIEYFDGSTQVCRRVFPEAPFEVNGISQTGFEVDLISKGKLASVRFLTGGGRLVKVLDYLKYPPETYVVPAGAVFNETLNLDHFKPCVDEATARLLAECFASESGYLHMDRLLVQ